MGHARLPRVLVAVVVLIAGIAVVWVARTPRRNVGGPRPYQGSAVIGNGRMLVALDGRGTIIDIWSDAGKSAIHNPRWWIQKGTTPLHTGAFLGIQRGSGGVLWLREAKVLSQAYVRDTNVLETRYLLPDDSEVTVTDYATIDADLVVRHVWLDPPQYDTYVIAFQNFDLGGRSDNDRARYDNGVIYQTCGDTAVVAGVGSSAAPASVHIGTGESLDQVSRGQLNNRKSGSGDVATVLRWPVHRSITLFYSFAPSRRQSQSQITKFGSSSPKPPQVTVESHWKDWLARAKPIDIPDKSLALLYKRSLLTLQLMHHSDTGAIAAGARSYWRYCWPRDAVFTSVAFDLAGYHDEAESVYRFLADVQPNDGLWEARYKMGGREVGDGRVRQIDAAGYFPWGVWLHLKTTGDDAFAGRMYPHVKRAAGHILAHLDAKTGLPGPSSDYWESSHDLDYYLSNAVVCWAGLASAAELAREMGLKADMDAYQSGACRIKRGVETHLWDARKQAYVRSTDAYRGLDTAACWAVSPFGMFESGDLRVASTVEKIASRLTTSRGGLVPGEDWPRHDPWVPETAFALLYYAAARDTNSAMDYFDWIAGAAAEPGTLPEKISTKSGKPDSTTPLAWSHACFILAATEMWGAGIPKPSTDPPGR